MHLIDTKKYQNEIKVANRAEYDKYIVTVFDSKTNEVYASFIEAINFDLEDKLKDTLVEVMNQSFPHEDGKEYEYVEHTHSVILNVLEDEQNTDSYLDQVMVDMTKFRMRLKEEKVKNRGQFSNTKWICPDSVKDVVVAFNKIDGFNDYHQMLHAFSSRELELRNQFDVDFKKATGVDTGMYKFLTKSISTEDREQYMINVVKKVNEYLDVLAESE